MFKTLSTSVFATLMALLFASVAFAQTGMIKGKVVGPDGKTPVIGARITIEFTGGVNRKMDTKTDKRGEFIQIGLQSGAYKVTATDDKLGSQSFPAQVRVGQTAEVNFVLGAGGPGAGENPKAAELKKLFEEGVTASRANQHDVAIEKFTAAAGIIPNCHDCYYNIGYAYLQKKDEKQAEAAWLKALELKADYSEALNALATLYNNQKRFDEASAMSAKAASAGGGGSGNADAIYNQGIILWNQGKIAEAKTKFEEALAANPSHAEANFQLGMALLNEGKIPEAVASFEKYLSLAPTGQFADQAKAMLAQLKKM
jgi:tetratricopeptide (TPR) repeat protein